MYQTETPLNGAGLDGLAEEQASFRRVATLVARGAPQQELFASVTAGARCRPRRPARPRR
jgi:hypothetical protein